MSELKHSDDLMDGGWMDKDAFRTALDTWDRIRYTDRDINETLTSYISQNACIHRAASGQKICLRIRMIRETAPGAVPEHRPEDASPSNSATASTTAACAENPAGRRTYP